MAEITIAVMGATGSGKSTFINIISGSHLQVGEGLRSCTAEVWTSQPFELSGRHITLIDTPGFDDTLESDTEILKRIATFLTNSYRVNQKLSGIIYMHRISDFKVTGISRRNFGMFRSLCGEATLRNVVIATNMWSEVDQQLGNTREQELATDNVLFKPVLDKGARLMRHLNTVDSARTILNHLINNHPLPLQIQQEIVDQNKAIEQTVANQELKTEAQREAERQQAEAARRQREEMAAALKAQEERKARELEALRRQQAAEEARLRAEQERMRIAQEQQRQREEQQRQEAARALAEQEAARVAEQARLEQIRAEQARQAQEQEEARRRHQQQMERERNRRRRHDECVIA